MLLIEYEQNDFKAHRNILFFETLIQTEAFSYLTVNNYIFFILKNVNLRKDLGWFQLIVINFET